MRCSTSTVSPATFAVSSSAHLVDPTSCSAYFLGAAAAFAAFASGFFASAAGFAGAAFGAGFSTTFCTSLTFGLMPT